MNSLVTDLRFGWRKLTREPGFALAAIPTIGLGTGTSTAIFTIVNGVLLQPVEPPDAARVVSIHRLDDNTSSSAAARSTLSPASPSAPPAPSR